MQQGNTLINNLMWFLASLGLAFIVWLVATTQSDPIETRNFPGIVIQYQPDSGLIVVNPSLRTATVSIRAQRSVMNQLTNEDITVRAKLQGVSAGTKTVELEATVARRATADTKPAQVTLVIEQELREQKPVRANIVEPPPVGFVYGQIQLSESQVLVTGVESKVEQVEHLEAPVNLSNQRSNFNQEVQLIPLDVNGNRVSDVTVAQPVRVTVEVTSDEAIEQVLVSPSVDRLSLPSDYIFLGIEDFSPKTVSVTGDKDALDALPVEVETETIDLSQATGNFTAEVGVVLPEGVTLAEPEQKITVTLLVEAREDLKQLNDIPVEVRGGSVSTVVRVVPDEVTVLVRGPQPVLRELTEADVQVVVDVQGLAEGNHDLVPTVMVDNADIVPGDVSVLPNRIGVSIEDTQTNTPSVTPTTQSEATPQS